MTEKNLLKNEEAAVFELRKLYSSFGYQQFKMSKFEEYDLYVRNKSFLVSDHVYRYQRQAHGTQARRYSFHCEEQ